MVKINNRIFYMTQQTATFEVAISAYAENKLWLIRGDQRFDTGE